MPLNAQRRFIAAFALLALLFGAVSPALAVVRQALDPAAFASICRVDDSAASHPEGKAAHDRLKAAHCPLCLGHAAPPSAAAHVPQCIGAVSELRLPAQAAEPLFADTAALQPLNSRAPPRA